MRKSYIIDVKAHFKRKPSSIYIFTSYHPPIVKMDLTNKKPWESCREVFQISKSGWWTEAGHTILKEKLLLEVKLIEGKQRSWNKTTRKKKKYCLSWHNTSPSVSIMKEALMKKCNLIQNQTLPWQLNPRTYTQNHTPHHGTRGGYTVIFRELL